MEPGFRVNEKMKDRFDATVCITLCRIERAVVLHILMILSLLMLHELSFSQVIPDGTEGEVLDTNDFNVEANRHKYANWNKFDGPLTTLKIGAWFLYDFVAYSQDNVNKEQIELEPEFKVRDFRITLSGRFKFKRDVTWKAGIMYDGPSETWYIRETGIMVAVPELSGHIFIGRTKEGFSLNKIMIGYAGWTMEREMGTDIIPILADGVKWLGFLPKQRILWNIGIFADWFSKDQSFSTYNWQAIARIGWLPVYSEDRKTLLHIAFNGRYGMPEDGIIRVRSRPEASPAPYFVDTDTFPSDYSIHLGGEAYFSTGRWMFGMEYSVHKFNSPVKKNPLFHGGEVVASCIITGERRPYSTATGIYGLVPVNRPVFRGGPGAWETVLRFSNIDLDSGTLSGGKFWRITPMINWYLSENVRFELAYGYGVLDRFNKTGATHFFQSRIQLML
jgi:phosphate-selective porin OprO and OprP